MDSKEFKSKTLKLVKKTTKVFFIVFVLVLVFIILLGASKLQVDFDDTKVKANDLSNAPFVVSQYTKNVSVDSESGYSTSMTAQELWDLMKKNNNRGLQYLDSAEELLKLMNAEVVTQFMDIRENPDEDIDWDSLNDVNSKNVQGIIKLKRSDLDGKVSTMTYVEPEIFQSYIEDYNRSGSEKAKKRLMSHFTLETKESLLSDNNDITEDDVGIIKGEGNFHQYTDLTDSQLKAIANLCQQEQTTPKGAAAEASLMANRFELYGKRYGSGAEGLYKYVRNSGWFDSAPEYMDTDVATEAVIKAVKKVLKNGIRTLPKYVDEHVTFGNKYYILYNRW